MEPRRERGSREDCASKPIAARRPAVGLPPSQIKAAALASATNACPRHCGIHLVRAKAATRARALRAQPSTVLSKQDFRAVARHRPDRPKKHSRKMTKRSTARA